MNNDRIIAELIKNGIYYRMERGRIIARDKYGILIDVTGFFKIELKIWMGY